MSDAEPTQEPVSTLPNEPSPVPNWLRWLLAKWWWLLVLMVLGLLTNVVLLPLNQGIAHWGQGIEQQIDALIRLPTTHPYVAVLLAALLPLLTVGGFLADQGLKRKERSKLRKEIIDVLQFSHAPVSQSTPDLAFSKSEDKTGSSIHPAISVWNVPSRNPYFTGRLEVLEPLHRLLNKEPDTIQIQALTGLGGIGKTQTAVEYAYRYRQDYQAALWIPAESREEVLGHIIDIVGWLINVPEHAAEKQDNLVAAFRQWLMTHPHWLVILDNLTDWDILRDIVPSRGQGHILVTSRSQATGTMASALTLKQLRPEEGALFLLRRAKLLSIVDPLSKTSSTLQAEAVALVEQLGGLPLALDQTGAYIEESKCSLIDYLKLYQTQHMELLRQRGTLVQSHAESVFVSWLLAFERVQKENAAAADLLRACAFLAAEGVPEELFTEGGTELPSLLHEAGGDQLRWNQTLKVPLKYSLLSREAERKFLGMHPLVQMVQRDSLSEQDQKSWAECAILLINRAFPEVEFAVWERCQRLLPNALQGTRLIEQRGCVFPEAARLLHQTGRYLVERAQYKEAQPLLERALALREQMLGDSNTDVAISMNDLAGLYYQRGEYRKALPLLKRALEIYEQVQGLDALEVANNLDGLARLYQAQSQYEDALPLYQQALALREQVLEQNHPALATSFNNLAELYFAKGEYGQALPFAQRALAIREQKLEATHPDLAQSLNMLAEIYRAMLQPKQALPLFQRALAIREQTLQPNHPSIAASLNNLAELYFNQNQIQLAIPLFERALRIDEQAYGKNHPDMAATLFNLGAVYQKQNHDEQALGMYKRALEIYEQTLRADHPRVAACLEHYASLLRKLKQVAKAQELEARAQAILDKQQSLNYMQL